MPISQLDDGKWTVLAPQAIVPMARNAVGVFRPTSAVTRQFYLRSPNYVAAVLATTPVDPIAAKYMNLSPYQRGRMVIEARESANATHS